MATKDAVMAKVAFCCFYDLLWAMATHMIEAATKGFL